MSTDDCDVAALLAETSMSFRQWLAVAVCVVINVVDGFEILVAGFTAPAIAEEMGLATELLGLFLSAGPAGMIIGAFALSPLADFMGRRQLVLMCLCLCAGGMVAALVSNGFLLLLAARLLTGVGVGGMMVAVNTVVAEVTNRRRRDLCLVLQATGFPLGGALCGWVASLVPAADWRHVYGAGGAVALLLIPIVLLYLPESIQLQARRSRHALKVRLHTLFSPGSMTISLSFFLMMVSFYFLSSWAPKLLSASGSAKMALSGAALVSAGGVLGDLGFAALTLRWKVRRLGPIFAVAAFASAILLALSVARPDMIPIAALLLGFFLYGAMASHYAIVPGVYAADVRASGSGLAIGTGRIGAAVGPLLGAVILAAGTPLLLTIAIMSVPVLLCALLLRSAANYSVNQ